LLIFFFFSVTAFGANRIYFENFDNNQINNPSIGKVDAYLSLSPKKLAIKGVDFSLSQPGRNGSKGSFLSLQTNGKLDAEAFLIWNYSSSWPSTQMYVSFWQRFPHFVSTDTHENIKTFYPHWDGALSYVHYSISSSKTMYLSERANGEMISTGNWLNTPNQTDGKWHHYEFFIDVKAGVSKFWYDGNLVRNKNYGPGTWNTPFKVYYLTFGMIDAEEPGNFTRQFDDIEVWDGIPSDSQKSTETVSSKLIPPGTPKDISISN
jgi:hypothetical protein